MIVSLTCLLVFGPLAALAQASCTSNNLRGICKSTSTCSGKSVSGLCAGAADNQCCIPTGTICSANGGNGVCVSTSSCAGTSVSGHCPGAADVQCCVSTVGSSADLCGSYTGASVTPMMGNYGVVYSVVKIRREHQGESKMENASSIDSDNTMTTKIACAFDKMASAAKQEGVIITINSGFRTLARQQYFWGCYQTKLCNNGNVAAEPGTSNHGDGIALDLNTNCGKQSGSKPPPLCDTSSVYQWLYNHAHNYGFTRKVPSEPWHWVYVGPGASPASYS